MGVGAVVLAGCDLVADAKASVFGEDEVVATAPQSEAVEAATRAEPPPEPMLLSRGVGDVVERTLDKPKPVVVEPVSTVGRAFHRPGVEPVASRKFVPYESKTTPRTRRSRKARSADAPCNPGSSKSKPVGRNSGWDCPACGRG